MKTITLADVNSLSDPEWLALNADLIIEDTSLDELENRVVVGADYEVEHEVMEYDPEDGRLYHVCTDDNVPVENSACYWTTTGDNPVIETLAAKNDSKCRNINEILPPNKESYSAAKPLSYNKETHRNYIKTMIALRRNAGDMNKLRQLWKRFWKKFFYLKAMDDQAERRNNPRCLFRKDPVKQMDKWLKPWHIKRIRLMFNSLGIDRRKKV